MRQLQFRLAGFAVVLLGSGLAAQQGSKDAGKLEALVEQLGAADANLRSEAYSTLQRDRNPEVVVLLGKRIDTLPPDGQQYALYLLQQHPIDATRALYARLLGAERALLRAHAAAALVRSGDRTKLPALVDAVATAPANDRQLVLNTLWSIEAAPLVDAVRGYVRPDGQANLVVSALQHLRQQEKTPSPATTAAVRALLPAADTGVRAAALVWLASGDGGDAHAAELAKLFAEEPNRFWLVERLLLRDRKYPAVLADAFTAALAAPRSQYDVTQLAALLKTQAPDRLAPTLRTLLDHANDDVRAAAIQTLATVPGGLQAKELPQLLQTGSPEQRLAIAAVLRRMDDVSGLPVVLELCKQPGKHRAEAIRVLGGFRSRDAVEPLLLALDDNNPQVRQHAWTAVQQLWRDLHPYRRFDFARAGYDPNAADRAAGIQLLRTWWTAAR